MPDGQRFNVKSANQVIVKAIRENVTNILFDMVSQTQGLLLSYKNKAEKCAKDIQDIKNNMLKMIEGSEAKD